MRETKTETQVKYWLGDRVSIIEPDLSGIICQVIFEGSIKEAIHFYRVRYWANGEMHEANFDDEELMNIDLKPPMRIGFNNKQKGTTL